MYETSCWEESVSSQWVDRTKTIAREDEVLAQYSKQRVDRMHTKIKIPQAKDQQQISSWEEDGSSQGEDRVKATAQQKKYGTSCWEESVSSQWVDGIKTTTMEDKGLAQYSATQEKFSSGWT